MRQALSDYMWVLSVLRTYGGEISHNESPFAYLFVIVPSGLSTTLYHLTWQDVSRPSQTMDQAMSAPQLH